MDVGMKENKDTTVLFKKSTSTIRRHSRSSSIRAHRNDITAARSKQRTNRDHAYYHDGLRLKRDLSIETDICKMRNNIKHRCSKDSYSTKSRFSAFADGDSILGKDSVTTNITNRKTNADVVSLIVDNFKDLLNKWIRDYLLDSSDNLQKIENIRASLLQRSEKIINQPSISIFKNRCQNYNIRRRSRRTECLVHGNKSDADTKSISKYSTTVSNYTIPLRTKTIKMLSTLSLPKTTRNPTLHDLMNSGPRDKVMIALEERSDLLADSTFVLLTMSSRSFTKRCTYLSESIKHLENKPSHLNCELKNTLFKYVTERKSKQSCKECCLKISPLQNNVDTLSLVKDLYYEGDAPLKIKPKQHKETMTDINKSNDKKSSCRKMNWNLYTSNTNNLKYKNFTHLYRKAGKKHLVNKDLMSHLKQVLQLFDNVQGEKQILLDVHMNVKPIGKGLSHKNKVLRRTSVSDLKSLVSRSRQNLLTYRVSSSGHNYFSYQHPISNRNSVFYQKPISGKALISCEDSKSSQDSQIYQDPILCRSSVLHQEAVSCQNSEIKKEISNDTCQHEFNLPTFKKNCRCLDTLMEFQESDSNTTKGSKNSIPNGPTTLTLLNSSERKISFLVETENNSDTAESTDRSYENDALCNSDNKVDICKCVESLKNVIKGISITAEKLMMVHLHKTTTTATESTQVEYLHRDVSTTCTLISQNRTSQKTFSDQSYAMWYSQNPMIYETVPKVPKEFINVELANSEIPIIYSDFGGIPGPVPTLNSINNSINDLKPTNQKQNILKFASHQGLQLSCNSGHNSSGIKLQKPSKRTEGLPLVKKASLYYIQSETLLKVTDMTSKTETPTNEINNEVGLTCSLSNHAFNYEDTTAKESPNTMQFVPSAAKTICSCGDGFSISEPNYKTSEDKPAYFQHTIQTNTVQCRCNYLVDQELGLEKVQSVLSLKEKDTENLKFSRKCKGWKVLKMCLYIFILCVPVVVLTFTLLFIDVKQIWQSIVHEMFGSETSNTNVSSEFRSLLSEIGF